MLDYLPIAAAWQSSPCCSGRPISAEKSRRHTKCERGAVTMCYLYPGKPSETAQTASRPPKLPLHAPTYSGVLWMTRILNQRAFGQRGPTRPWIKLGLLKIAGAVCIQRQIPPLGAIFTTSPSRQPSSTDLRRHHCHFLVQETFVCQGQPLHLLTQHFWSICPVVAVPP